MSDLMERLKAVGAYQEGHFRLTSGRHSPAFLLLARAFEDPQFGGELGRRVAQLFAGERVEAVVGPAMGGVLLAYEVARHLRGVRALFAEKADGGMVLRRGFSLSPGERVLVVEDVITTGGSVAKVLEHVRGWQAKPVGVGAVVDRSGGRAGFGSLPLRSALQLDLPQYEPDECPQCRAGVPLVLPKS
jgi:orotate phosphoribosyltransferase